MKMPAWYQAIGFFIAIVTTLTIAPGLSKAEIGQDQAIGAGVGVGSVHTSFTARYYFHRHFVAQAFVGAYEFGSGVAVDGDVVMPFGPFWENDDIALGFGIGGGGGTVLHGFEDEADAIFFANGVGELYMHFKDVPIELIVDWRPTILLGDDKHSGLALAEGRAAARWYF